MGAVPGHLRLAPSTALAPATTLPPPAVIAPGSLPPSSLLPRTVAAWCGRWTGRQAAREREAWMRGRAAQALSSRRPGLAADEDAWFRPGARSMEALGISSQDGWSCKYTTMERLIWGWMDGARNAWRWRS